MLIETTKGPVEEGLLNVMTGEVDDAASFRIVREYRLGGEIVRRDEAIIVPKVNPFYRPPENGIIKTTRGHMQAGDLVRTTGSVDAYNEFACWVEYRAPGEAEIIHRSASVALKRNVVAETMTGKAG